MSSAILTLGLGRFVDPGLLATLGLRAGEEPIEPPPPAPTFGSLGQAPYTDIRRWTRKGDALKVRARAVTLARPQLRNVAGVRQFRPASQYAAALPVVATPTSEASQCVARILPIRLVAFGAGRKEASIGAAKAQTTERQDVADILTIMELLEDQFDD